MSKSEAAIGKAMPFPARVFPKRRLAAILFLATACIGGTAGAQMLPLSHAVDGRTITYTVKAGDTLTDISSRFGEDRTVLARENGIDPNNYAKPLIIGQQLTVDNRHIVPAVTRQNDIFVNLAQRRLFHFKDGQLVHTYLIGAGDPSWQTPTGPFHIINHIKGKTWIVPASIQAEMRAHGQPVITSMPPGPDNPLGGYWMGTSLPNIGIHGTIDPDSVYRYASHGCMHMRKADIRDLFSRVKVGDQGETVYAPVLLAELPDGRIYLEAHPDVYHKDAAPYAEVKAMADAANLSDFIDWNKVSDVLAKQEGFAIKVGQRDDYETRLKNWLNGDDAGAGAEAADPDHTSNPDALPEDQPGAAAPIPDTSHATPGQSNAEPGMTAPLQALPRIVPVPSATPQPDDGPAG